MSDDVRTCFEAAAASFTAMVGRVAPGQWSAPAVGQWDVRSLVGHTSRALETVRTYLGRSVDGPMVPGPVEYYLAALGRSPDTPQRRRLDEAIAERGRQAGVDLGDRPATAVTELAEDVVRLVRHTSDDAVVGTPAGPMTLMGYLPTRTFELAVHGLDLCRSLGIEVPDELAPALESSCVLAAQLAARRHGADAVLLGLTGRGAGSASASF